MTLDKKEICHIALDKSFDLSKAAVYASDGPHLYRIVIDGNMNQLAEHITAKLEQRF